MSFFSLGYWSFKEFLTYWKTDFYSIAISFALAVIGLIVSLKRKQHYKLRPLIFFFLSYVLMEIIRSAIRGVPMYKILREQVRVYLDLVDTIVEFFTLFIVIKNYVISSRIREVLKLLPLVFMVLITAFFLHYEIGHGNPDQYFLQTIFTIQASLLIVACVLYYIDIFTREPKLKLTDDPSFWVATGVVFFMLCTLPFSILGMYLVKTNFNLYVQLFAIFEVFYWILFLMIIKAYFCRPIAAQ
jgi:hypothetical protein